MISTDLNAAFTSEMPLSGRLGSFARVGSVVVSPVVVLLVGLVVLLVALVVVGPLGAR